MGSSFTASLLGTPMHNDDLDLGKAQKLADLAQERIKLIASFNDLDQKVRQLSQDRQKVSDRLAEIDNVFAETMGTPKPKLTINGKRRGRPPGSKNKPKTGLEAAAELKEKTHLMDLLINIASKSKKDLTLPEFVKLSLESGYKSDSNDFSNVVYQNLNKLVNKKVFERDAEKKTYKLIKAEND